MSPKQLNTTNQTFEIPEEEILKEEMKTEAERLIRQRADLKKQLAHNEMEIDLLAINATRGGKKKKTTFRVVRKDMKSKVTKTKKMLSARDTKVISLLKEGKMTQAQIAKEVGIHQAQVSQIKKKAGLPMLSAKEVSEKMRKANKTSKKAKKAKAKKVKKAKKSKKIEGPLTHFVLKNLKNCLLDKPEKDHNFESMFKKFVGDDQEKSLRANFSKIVAYATNEGSILRTKSRPLTVRKRNLKKIKSLNIIGFNTYCASTKKKRN